MLLGIKFFAVPVSILAEYDRDALGSRMSLIGTSHILRGGEKVFVLCAELYIRQQSLEVKPLV